jgi:putative hydrolase
VDNATIAERLREIADLLEEQGANRFRVGAYRRAAETLASHPEEASVILARGGREALVQLPHIGSGLAATIEGLVRSGRSGMLDRLRGETDPETLFQSLPGIGPKLAERIHDTLHIDSLEALELAAHDGRLDKVPGFGEDRIETIRAVLADRLGGGGPRTLPPNAERPSIESVLEIDRLYRRDAREDRLPRIAPRRFNPRGEAWLPVGHHDLEGWHFTALFSNTALAHRLGRTHDWVVIFFYDGDHNEGQHTVVTERRGAMSGLRVVRGREAECRVFYRDRDQLAS